MQHSISQKEGIKREKKWGGEGGGGGEVGWGGGFGGRPRGLWAKQKLASDLDAWCLVFMKDGCMDGWMD